MGDIEEDVSYTSSFYKSRQEENIVIKENTIMEQLQNLAHAIEDLLHEDTVSCSEFSEP